MQTAIDETTELDPWFGMTNEENKLRKERCLAADAAAKKIVTDLVPEAVGKEHCIGPAEWFDVKMPDGTELGYGDLSTRHDGERVAWTMAAKHPIVVAARNAM